MGGTVNTGGQQQQTSKVENTNQAFNNQQQANTAQQQLQAQQQQYAQQQQATPWDPAGGILANTLSNVGALNPNLSSGEQQALSQLGVLGQQGNQFQGGINSATNTLLGGGNYDPSVINQAYANYQNQVNPVANASLNPWQTPGFSDAWNTLQGDITNNINSQFAGAGRDLSGMNTQTLARGLMQGGGQLLANQYNQNVNNRLNAAGNLFGGGATTQGILGNQEQQRLATMQAGIPAAQSAFQAQTQGPMLMLQAEAARRGIPLETLAAQMGLTLPAAQAFATQTGAGTSAGQGYGTATGQSSGTSSGTQTGTTSTTGTSATQNQVPLWQQLVGGTIGGAGLLGGMGAFGNNGWLNFGR